jgi:hypothetical protein
MLPQSQLQWFVVHRRFVVLEVWPCHCLTLICHVCLFLLTASAALGCVELTGGGMELENDPYLASR